MDRSASRIEKHRATLHLLARLQLADDLAGKVDVSGVVQETLFEAYCRAPADEAASDEAVLQRLCRLLSCRLIDAIRRVRRRGSEPVRECSLEQALDESSARLEQFLAVDETTLYRRLERNEELRRLAEALERLPEDQRQAVELHHLQGLTLAEVGQRLGRSRVAAAGLVLRGVRKLREHLRALPLDAGDSGHG